MSKFVIVLALVAIALAGPVRAEPQQSEPTGSVDLIKEAGQACVFGGAVLGLTAIVVLYPALASGTANLPVGSIVGGNALFGCGIATIGAMAARAFSFVYEKVVDGSASAAPAAAPVGAS